MVAAAVAREGAARARGGGVRLRRTRPRCGAGGRRGGGAAAPVKALVAGLTAVANAVAGVDARAAEREAQRLSEEDTREPISPQQVLEGVRADFVDNR